MKNGKAEVGDRLVTPWGEWREVEKVTFADDLIPALTDGRYYRRSHAEQCAMYGTTKTDRPKQWTAAQRAAREEPVR